MFKSCIRNFNKAAIGCVVTAVAVVFVLPARADDERKLHVKKWEAMHESGKAALEKKEYREAKQFFTAELDEARQLDPKDSRVAQSLVDLGNIDLAFGEARPAEALLREAVAARHGDPNPVLEAQALFSWGMASERLEHMNDAVDVYQRAGDILSRKLGVSSPETATCDFRLGLVYAAQRNYAKAEPLLKRSYNLFRYPPPKIVFRKGDSAAGGMDVFRVNYRAHYVYALQAVAALSQMYIVQNRAEEADKSFKEALDLVDEYAGKNDPEVAEVLKAMSGFYFSSGKYAAAEPVLVRLVKVEEGRLGATNESVMVMQDRLAQTYVQEKKATQAEAIYKKVIEEHEKISGADSRETMVAVGNLGRYYVEQGDYAKAEPLYRRQAENVEKFQGDSPEMAPILTDQIAIYSKLGKDEELEKTYRRQIAVYERIFGATNKSLIKPLNECTEVLRREKKDAEAEALEARVKAIQGN